MERVPTPAEVFKPKADITRNNPAVTSAVATLSLRELELYPNPEYSISAIERSTGDTVTATYSETAHPYRCKVCKWWIGAHEPNVVISGLIAYRNGQELDHHHLHSKCLEKILPALKDFYKVPRDSVTQSIRASGWKPLVAA